MIYCDGPQQSCAVNSRSVKMSQVCLLLLVLLAGSTAWGFQSLVPAKSALERRGLPHATIRRKFPSPSGDPVARVRVQMNAGRPRTLPLVDVFSGPDGAFEIHDVEQAPTMLNESTNAE